MEGRPCLNKMGKAGLPWASAPCVTSSKLPEISLSSPRVHKKQINENHILPHFLERVLSGDAVPPTTLLQSSSDICGHQRPCPKQP